MPDLGDLMGLLVSGVARARRMADEESALIAEQYRRNPLLEGLSVPRVRIPEMTVELPLLLQAYEPGRAAVPNDAKKIVAVITSAANRSVVGIAAARRRTTFSMVCSRSASRALRIVFPPCRPTPRLRVPFVIRRSCRFPATFGAV